MELWKSRQCGTGVRMQKDRTQLTVECVSAKAPGHSVGEGPRSRHCRHAHLPPPDSRELCSVSAESKEVPLCLWAGPAGREACVTISRNPATCFHQTLYTKTTSKWITDLNGRARTLKLLEEKTGENLHDLKLGKEFLDIKSTIHATKMIRLTSLKFELLCFSRQTPYRK